jgi:DNA-binding transcriptional LysR family regulator
MELTQLRAFLAVLDTGSLLTASKSLQISRTTLHARIEALEASLGVKLLVRTTRGVQPTEFGRNFADGARALLQRADALVHSTTRQSEEVIGELRARVTMGFPPQLQLLLHQETKRRYPDIAAVVQVCEDPTRDVPDDVDVIVHFGAPPSSGAFRTFTLIRFPERLLASRRYLDAHGRPQSLDELAEHPLLSWSHPQFDGRHLPLLAGGTVEVAPIYISNDIMMVRTLTSLGYGIALLPDAEIGKGLVPDLEPVLSDVVGRETGVCVLLPEAQADTPRSRAAVRLMRDLMAGAFAAAQSSATVT